ncbi:MAG: hypothetical protein QOG09_410 [Solirubrobacterales bacterium]|nr:hypothetical protein [Solirubrobacterales bacterium]
MSAPERTPPDPLFIGGTGRCGSHALARLLNRHSRYRTVPVEVRFHSDPPGLPALLAGRTELERFVAELRGPWWESTHSDGSPRGLSRYVAAEDFEPAVAQFERDYDSHPFGASAHLIRSLLDPFASAEGKPSWVEHTKNNVASGATLLELFPEAKIIHILRDGRDTAASLVHQSFGPDRFKPALAWWEERLAATERGAAELPAERLMMLRVEDLVERDRDATYERLLEFLELDDEQDMRWFFDRRLRPDRANAGRWRQGLSAGRRRRVTKRYAGALERLIAADTPARGLLEDALSEARADDTP